jgi:hypothetical protein
MVHVQQYAGVRRRDPHERIAQSIQHAPRATISLKALDPRKKAAG